MENNKTYAIVAIAELNNVDYSQVEQNSADTVRKNLADTEFVVKWEGATPSSIAAITPSPTQYTHAEIVEVMSGPDWTDPYLNI